MTPKVQVLTLTNADTEYYITLSPNVRFFSWQSRTPAHVVRFAYESGKVAGSTNPYETKQASQAISSPVLSGQYRTTPLVIYFASSTAGAVIELEEWH